MLSIGLKIDRLVHVNITELHVVMFSSRCRILAAIAVDPCSFFHHLSALTNSTKPDIKQSARFERSL
jgi:hypothetical protein